MHNGFKTRAERAPDSFAALLFCAKMRPPLGHDNEHGTKNFLPQPSQSVVRFKGTMPYQKRRLSFNSSLENSVPLRQWGIAVSHAPLSVGRRRWISPATPVSSFYLSNSAFSKNPLSVRPSALDLHTHNLWATYLRLVPPTSEPTRTLLDALEVLYARFANRRVSGIPMPMHFTLWPRISLRSVLTSSPPKSGGKKASLREFSIGPIRDPTPGTVLCRYCHLIWSDIPNPEYADWGYHLDILARVQTLWFY